MKIWILLPNWGVKTHDWLMELKKEKKKKKRAFESKKILGLYSFFLEMRPRMSHTVVYVRLVGLLVSFCYTVLFLILPNFLLIPDSPSNF